MHEPSDALVIFGITGDLAYKKIFPALQALVRRGRLTVPVVGVARSGTLENLVERARASLEADGSFDQATFDKLAALLRLVSGDYNDSSTFERLRQALGDTQRPLYYLAIPPTAFPVVITHLTKTGCSSRGARVVIEKPFGRDLQSARALNATLRAVFPEEAIFRIDHYLGKEAMQNILYFDSRTPSSSPSGIASTSTTCRSRWPRTSASPDAARSTRRPASFATSSRITCCRS